jgi:dTDP-4-dehydrorhamnose 3,5-epimerase
MTLFHPLGIPDVIEITPRKFGDERGFFSEVFKRADFETQGLDIDWVQDNQSFSAPVGTVRGLHFQAPPFAQHKLVRVVRGAIFDVAVDIRKGSPTFGRWVGAELSAEKWNQLLVPIGFAHGFMTIRPDTEVIYKVSARYAPDSEGAVLWNDPAIGIEWPEPSAPPTLSSKDQVAPPLSELDSPFSFEG